MKKTISTKLLEQNKAEVTQFWFAATQERDQKRKAILLEQYRQSKRRYDAQQLLMA
jgi:hypothetical protein